MNVEISGPGNSGSIVPIFPRFRLYIDESGDASPSHLKDPTSQFLCLLGCIFEDKPYRIFHDGLETLKRSIFADHHPDDPVVLHRTDLINPSGPYEILKDTNKRIEFNRGILELISGTQFKIVASVIDKNMLAAVEQTKRPFQSGDSLGRELANEREASVIMGANERDAVNAAKKSPIVDSYGHAYRYLLSGYTEFLEQEDAKSIIMLEARGGRADNLLKQAHDTILEVGMGQRTGLSFRNRFNPAQLDIRQKNKNISGLQLADILCHSIKCWILKEMRLRDNPLGPFTEILIGNIRPLLLSHEVIYDAARGYLLRPRRPAGNFD